MYEPEVKRGAALLDGLDPNWATKIDLETLQMSVTCNCVLGQVFGGYEEGLAAALDQTLEETRFTRDEDLDKIQDHGFCIYDRTFGRANVMPSDSLLWTALEETWIKLIQLRQS